MFKALSKKVLVPILVVVIIILVGGVFAYQYWWLPKEEAKLSKIKASEEIGNNFIIVTFPKEQQEIESPVNIVGKANVFEGTVSIKIKDNNKILADTFITAEGSIDKLYPFSKEVVYSKPSSSGGTIEIFEKDQKDGTEKNKIIIPIIFKDYTVAEGVDWETYRNDNYGYEIKYPSIYNVIDETEQGQKVTIGNAAVPAYGISINKNDASSLEKLKSSMEKSLRNLAPVGLKITWKDTTISGEKAVEMSYEGFVGGYDGTTHQTAVIKNNIGYIIQIIYGGSEKEYYQMISTFKFIEQKEPYIMVLSPNGGEQWKAGETHTISWQSRDVKNVIIVLNQGSSRSSLISPKTGISASLGKFDWTPEKSAFYVGRNDLQIIIKDVAYCGYIDQDTGIECIKDELKHGDNSNSYFSIIQ